MKNKVSTNAKLDKFEAKIVATTAPAAMKKNKNRPAPVEDVTKQLLVIEPFKKLEQWEKDPAFARYSQLKGSKLF